MEWYVEMINRFRWLILVSILFITVFLSTKITQLGFEGNYRIWFSPNSKALMEYDIFRATFGSDDAITIAFKSPKNGIFNEKAIKSIQRISSKLSKLSNIGRVDSILNFQYIHSNPIDRDDIIVEDFILSNALLTSDYLEEKKHIALNDPLIRGLYISNDGKTTMIIAKLSSNISKNEEVNIELIGRVKEILRDESARTSFNYHISGSPALNAAMADIADKEAMLFLPIAFILIVALLYYLYGSILGIIIPLSIVICACTVTLASQYYLGQKLNNFTINIPIFISAIGMADAIHLYIAWISNRQNTRDKKIALELSIKKNILPMSLTTLTTTIGFLTLASSQIVPVSTLGIAIGIGSISALIFTLLLAPALILIIPENYLPVANIPTPNWFRNFNYSEFIIFHNKKIVIYFIATSFFLSLGLLWTKIDSNVLKYFSQDVDVRRSSDFTSREITGPMIYEIIVDSGKNDGIKDPAFLSLVNQFIFELKGYYPEIRHASSINDIIKRFDNVINRPKVPSEEIKSDQNVNAQYLLMYSLSLPQGMEINDKTDISNRHMRITVNVDVVDSSRTLNCIAWCEQWWQKHQMEAKVVGQVAMFAHMESSLTSTLLYSIGSSIVLIGITMLLIIKNLKLLLIFLIPNLSPILMTLGFMGYADIPIDIGIAISGAIILGLAVDDTIYLFINYLQAKKLGHSTPKTLEYILHHSGSAMITTTLILSTAFIIFIFSDFIPNVHFALMTIGGLCLALLSDLLLAPALISLWHKED